jgi:hypothetical protein
MSDVKIITNNVPRFIIDAWELTVGERKEFDYLDWNKIDTGEHSAMFVRYKGLLYDLSDTEAITPGRVYADNPFIGWHGIVRDSFFSGVLFKFTDDNESVICGRYLA